MKQPAHKQTLCGKNTKTTVLNIQLTIFELQVRFPSGSDEGLLFLI